MVSLGLPPTVIGRLGFGLRLRGKEVLKLTKDLWTTQISRKILEGIVGCIKSLEELPKPYSCRYSRCCSQLPCELSDRIA